MREQLGATVEHFSVQDKRDLAHSSPVTAPPKTQQLGRAFFTPRQREGRELDTDGTRGNVGLPQADMWLGTISRGA